MEASLNKPIAIVTGAAGAIGAATCGLLRRAGYRVIGVDQQPVAEDGAIGYETDVADPAQVGELFDDISATHGSPAVLVNNAGVYRAYDFLLTTSDEFDDVYASNVRSAFLCGQAFARGAIRSGTGAGGAIVNVASVSGQMGSPDVAYGASKGAVIALTKSMSQALAHRSIRVNAVAPGIVISAMSDRIPADRRVGYADAIPMKRFADPEEIARVITALATETSSYMTGAVIDVNGGLHT